MNKQLREIASWRIVSELLRRYPNKFIIIETHPGGGTYDCLSLYTKKDEHCISLNRGGSLHVFMRFDSQHAHHESYPVWDELSNHENYKGVLDTICRLMNLKVPHHLPPSTSSVLVYRFIATFLAHSSFGVDFWECRNGMFDSSAPYECGGVKNDFDHFPKAKERLRINLKGDVLNQPAYRFWFIKKNNEPVLCLETSGKLWTKEGLEYNLMEIYKKEKRIWPIIYQTAGEMLP